jgi:hypothetical protein
VTTIGSEAQQAVGLLRAGVAALRSLDLSRLSGDELLDVLGEVETQRRAAVAVDHALIAELDQRNVAAAKACRDTVTLVALLLRIDAGEAKARVEAARELGPRRGLTGEALGPIFEHAAAAVAQGAISAQAARIVTRTIDALPADVQAARDVEIEQYLVEQARFFAAKDLRLIARRLVDTYDQDGRLASDADRERRRGITARQHADGTVSGSYCTDAVCGEALMTFFDAAAQPVAGPDGERDPRTGAQRRHDAIRDGLLTVLRSGALPDTGGITTTIVLTMTPGQLTDPDSSERLVATGHGALVDLDSARTLIGDAQVQPVLLGPLKRIEAYGDTHRIFTAGQRLAMIARDRGCSFPGCTVGPSWCEAHHVVPYASGGSTGVGNGTLLCAYHHRYFERLGYECHMIKGVPHWIAPSWIDRRQTPIRNSAHLPGHDPP